MGRSIMNTVTELLQPVENDLDDLILELKNLIGAGHPILQAAAEHLFSAGGKRLRPGIVLLISKAISPEFILTSKHNAHERDADHRTDETMARRHSESHG